MWATIWTEVEAVARMLFAELDRSSGADATPPAFAIDGPIGKAAVKLPQAGGCGR